MPSQHQSVQRVGDRAADGSPLCRPSPTDRLYIGHRRRIASISVVADGVSTARAWSCRVLKMTASARAFPAARGAQPDGPHARHNASARTRRWRLPIRGRGCTLSAGPSASTCRASRRSCRRARASSSPGGGLSVMATVVIGMRAVFIGVRYLYARGIYMRVVLISVVFIGAWYL